MEIIIIRDIIRNAPDYDHDVDIRLFDEINNDIDKKFIVSLIQTFQTIIISKSDEFNFNGYKLLYHENRTITKICERDAEGKKLLHNIPHYFIVLEKNDDQIQSGRQHPF
jgi:hypothetical protein